MLQKQTRPLKMHAASGLNQQKGGGDTDKRLKKKRGLFYFISFDSLTAETSF